MNCDMFGDPSTEGSKGGLARALTLTLGFLACFCLVPGLGPDSARGQGILSSRVNVASSSHALFNYVAFAQEASQSGDGQQEAVPASSGTGDLFSYIAGEQQSSREHSVRLAEAAAAKDAKAGKDVKAGSDIKAAPAAPAAPAAAEKAKMVKPAPDDPEGRYYVGSEPCKVCHAYLFDEFKLTAMGRMFKSGKETKQGAMECETCHGPASAHVNGGGGRLGGHIRSFRKADPLTSVADTNGVCLGCHENGDRTYWKASTHSTRDVACTDCHTVMRKVSPRYQLAKGNVMDTCFQCHKDRRAQMLRTAHMPMIEGKMSCTSCHNPHGSASETAMLKEATVNDTCYQCHADKRGPFLWEHPPVRENCLNCHEPHGSMHNSLLVVARQRLCQRCHTVPHAQAGLTDLGITGGNLRRSVSLACQNCHSNIHGSNSPSGSRWHR
jgi:DmsE family decaheme c-type cytochrome